MFCSILDEFKTITGEAIAETQCGSLAFLQQMKDIYVNDSGFYCTASEKSKHIVKSVKESKARSKGKSFNGSGTFPSIIRPTQIAKKSRRIQSKSTESYAEVNRELGHIRNELAQLKRDCNIKLNTLLVDNKRLRTEVAELNSLLSTQLLGKLHSNDSTQPSTNEAAASESNLNVNSIVASLLSMLAANESNDDREPDRNRKRRHSRCSSSSSKYEYECRHCGEQFKRRKYLDEHKDREHRRDH